MSSSDGASGQLLLTNFGFSIPNGASILGIQATIVRHADLTGSKNSITDQTVQLVKSGAASGNNKADGSTLWPTSDATANYGANNDLWGTTWTVANINASNFGILLTVLNSNDVNINAFVDSISLTVTYSGGTQTQNISGPLIMLLGCHA